MAVHDVQSSQDDSRAALHNDCVLVLAGGGNLGAVQAGQIIELLEAGIVPSRIIGCSVGSLNGAFMASDMSVARAQQLVDLWLSDRVNKIFGLHFLAIASNLVRRADHMLNVHGLRRLIDDEIPFKRLEHSVIPIDMLATNLRRGTSHWFTQGSTTDALCATTALPGIFPPVRIGDELFVDGGVINPSPFGRAFDYSPRQVWVLEMPKRTWMVPRRLNIVDVILRSFTIAAGVTEQPEIPGGVEMVHVHTNLAPEKNQGLFVMADFGNGAKYVDAGRASMRDVLSRR